MPGPQQPARQVATWQLAIADRDLATTAFITPHADSVRYTRRESNYCEMALQITDRDDLNALEGAVYSGVLRAWRNGINRFNGEFVELRETADSWELIAKDPYFNLNWREIRAAISYAATDTADIAWDLIDIQNGYESTHLRQGASPASIDVTRSFAIGERVSEKIEYLAKLAGSFYFTIDAVDAVAGVWADFVAHYPAGVLATDARFEFGTGTLENCTDYLRESLPLVNRINVVGETPTLIATAESGTSPALHGLWEGSRGQVLTGDTTALGEIAAAQITDAPEYRITFSAGPEAPQLFTDFDVGQDVAIIIRRLGRTLSGEKRVTEATVLLDPNSGAEELESVEVVE